MNAENTDHRPGKQKLEVAKEALGVDSALTFPDRLTCQREQQLSQANQDRNPVQLFWLIRRPWGKAFPYISGTMEDVG